MITEVLHDERIFALFIAVCLPMAGCNSGSCNIAAKISDMNRLTQQVIVESAYYSCIRAARYSPSGADKNACSMYTNEGKADHNGNT